MIKVNDELQDFTPSEPGADNKTKIALKMMLSDAGLSLTKAVKAMNEKYPDEKTTTQNISIKLSRDTIKFSEMVKLAEICGYNISFDRIGKKKSTSRSTADYEKSDEVKPIRIKNKTEQHGNKSFSELAIEGYAECQSVNFKNIIIVGQNAETAARWISDNQDSEMNETQEIMLLLAANRQFKVNCKPISKDDSTTYEML